MPGIINSQTRSATTTSMDDGRDLQIISPQFVLVNIPPPLTESAAATISANLFDSDQSN